MGVAPVIDIAVEEHKMIVELLTRYLPGTVAWAFGSRTKSSGTPRSDLDLVVFATPEQQQQVNGLRDAFEESNLPFRVDLSVWDDVSDAFRNHIEAEHVPMAGVAQSGGPKDWQDTRWGNLATLAYGRELQGGEPDHGPVGRHDAASSEGTPAIVGRTGGSRRIRDASDPRGLIGSAVHIKPQVELDTRWAYYTLLAQGIGKPDRGLVPTSTVVKDFHRLPVSVPPLTEQHAIANVLGTLDDKIELNRRTNATLEAMARALFRSWFIDFEPARARMEGRDTGLPMEVAARFPCRLADSEQGMIPEGWDIGTVDDAAKPVHGGLPPTSEGHCQSGPIPWYTAGDAPALSDVFAVGAERTIKQQKVDNRAATVLPSRTTVIPAHGAVGRIACLGRPMAVSQSCHGLRGTGGYGDYFIYWLVRRAANELPSRTHGTIFHTNIRRALALVDLVLPPAGVAQVFEAAVSPIMQRILNNLHQTRAVAALRDALLPKLVSGELRTDTVIRGGRHQT
ncbi:MAG: restriction endonuclease subunit S [Caldilineaceae bacterium]|nr:restriction endonuclease subunit S [Caldilineaceae bacterium]